MKLSLTSKAIVVLAISLAAATAAQAAAVSYFGNNNSANGAVVDNGTNQDPANQRNLFRNSLATSQTEAFNMAPIGELGTLSGLFGAGSGISLSASGGLDGVAAQVRRTNGSTWHGRFNTTGDPTIRPVDGTTSSSGWFETNRPSVSIDFATAVSAFGTFMTDGGDFRGSLKVEVFSGSDMLFEQTLIAGGTLGINGGLGFFGYSNDTTQFNRVLFTVLQANSLPVGQYDVLGFDDFITGTLRGTGGGGTVPEPASLALVGLSLALLGCARRRQSKA